MYWALLLHVFHGLFRSYNIRILITAIIVLEQVSIHIGINDKGEYIFQNNESILVFPKLPSLFKIVFNEVLDV